LKLYLIGEGCGSYDLRKICLDRDVEILGFLDPERPMTLRSKLPTVGLAEAAKVGDDTVWSASATTTPVHGVALNRADS
jgi:hypothetical protein